MLPSDAVITEARRWLGVKYRHQGRSRTGVDCIGLVVAVCRVLDLVPDDVYDPKGYGRMPAHGLLEYGVGRACTQIPAARAGCVVLLRWKEKDSPSHCAIFTGETIIHAYQSVGRVVEHGFRAHWPRLAHSFWALPGVSYE